MFLKNATYVWSRYERLKNQLIIFRSVSWQKTGSVAEGDAPNSFGKIGREISGTCEARPTMWL